MTATKLLGYDAMGPNTVVFKACVDRQSRLPLNGMYDEDLTVTGRHAARVRWGMEHLPPSGQCAPHLPSDLPNAVAIPLCSRHRPVRCCTP